MKFPAHFPEIVTFIHFPCNMWSKIAFKLPQGLNRYRAKASFLIYHAFNLSAREPNVF